VVIPPSLERQRSEDLLPAILDSIEDGILLVDHDLSIRLANRWMREKYSAKSPLIGKRCHEILRGRDSRCPDCSFSTCVELGAPMTHVIRHSANGGPAEWLEVSFHRVALPDSVAPGALGHVKDVTERKRTEELLRDEIYRRRILVEQSRDGIVVLNQDGSVYEANEEYARMLGYSVDEIRGLHIWDWNDDFGKDELLKMIETVDETGDHFQTRHRRKDGTHCEVEISTNGALYGERKLVFCVCRDVTEKKAMEAQIREMAIRDPLTEVFNRRYVLERLDEMVAEYSRCGRNFCVSIVDIDHFKTVNDAHGHLAGDFALKEFAHAIGSVVRPYDLLGRYGGEEFILVFTSIGGSEAVSAMERLMDVVRNRACLYEGRDIRLTFSCGLADSAEFPRGSLSVQSIISRADERLYEAKGEGRDRCFGPRT